MYQMLLGGIESSWGQQSPGRLLLSKHISELYLPEGDLTSVPPSLFSSFTE